MLLVTILNENYWVSDPQRQGIVDIVSNQYDAVKWSLKKKRNALISSKFKCKCWSVMTTPSKLESNPRTCWLYSSNWERYHNRGCYQIVAGLKSSKIVKSLQKCPKKSLLVVYEAESRLKFWAILDHKMDDITKQMLNNSERKLFMLCTI